jgi:manganese/zinc/iron transport system substrate-binding protein
MKKSIFFIILMISVCLACQQNPKKSENSTQSWMLKNGKIKVLSTIAMIDDLVKAIGGDYVDALTLIKGELNPHSYQLVKGDDEKLAFADLVFFNGLGLEHGPSLQAFLEHNRKSIGLGNQILKNYPELILYYEGQIDPHIWMDVSLWTKNLEYIVEALGNLDPDHKEYYQKNSDLFKKELLNMHQAVRDELQQVPQSQRYLVTSHDAFNYFTRAYLAQESEWQDGSWGARFAAPEGLAPESQLSTRHIQLIIEFLAKHHIYVLFPESNVSKDSIKKIVDAGKGKGMHLKISTDILYADAMGKAGSDGDSYQKMIQHNARVISYQLTKNHP